MYVLQNQVAVTADVKKPLISFAYACSHGFNSKNFNFISCLGSPGANNLLGCFAKDEI